MSVFSVEVNTDLREFSPCRNFISTILKGWDMPSDDNPDWLPDEDDIPDSASRRESASRSSVETTATADAGTTSEVGGPASGGYEEQYKTEVIGVPLQENEQVQWVGHPSRWVAVPGLVVSVLLFLGLIAMVLQAQFQMFGAMGLDTIGGLLFDGPSSPVEINMPWYAWAGWFVFMLLPGGWQEASRRWTNYVVTNYRVMRIKSFPGKAKDSTPLEDIKSFTSWQSPLERWVLGLGNVRFQPANNDLVVFNMIRDHEYWESRVKEMQRAFEKEQQVEATREAMDSGDSGRSSEVDSSSPASDPRSRNTTGGRTGSIPDVDLDSTND